MTRNLLCFGDSNTYGTPPIQTLGEPHRRYDSATRWTHRALGHLGAGWEMAECGLPGRTAQYDDLTMGAHMNGQIGLKIALESTGPLDAMTLMLGTNDVKAAFGATPEMITGGIASLIQYALSPVIQTRHSGFKILLICPPPVEEAGCLKAFFHGGRAKSLALPKLYADLAQAFGIGFLDAGELIKVSPIDGVHYDEAAHQVLGDAVGQALRDLTA